MAGTEGAYCTPIFSPDGQWLAFFNTRTSELQKISVQGGAPVTLVKAGAINGATWGGDDAIIYAEPDALGLRKISAAGGTSESITHVDSTKGETGHRWPAFLPGGKAFLFTIEKGNNPDDAQIVAQRLDTGQRRLLVQGGTFPQYVPAGYLVYVHGGRLMAVPFDAGRLQVRGQAIAVSEDVHESNFGGSQFGLSSQGSLVYVPPSTVQSAQRRLVWVNRNSAEQQLAAPAQDYDKLRLSPDGQRVAVEHGDQIWLYDLSRDTLSRLTFEGASNESPVWSPDGKRIAFASSLGGPQNLFWQLADGSGGRERLTTSDYIHVPYSWSPDGQLLAFIEINPVTQRDIWVLRLGDRRAQPFLRTPYNEFAPSFSPDGRWLAYASDESGRLEIYLQPYPGPGGKWQISTEGGTDPIWNHNGRELFYSIGNKMMAVDVATRPSFAAGKPRVLFEGQYATPGRPLSGITFDVSPDGQRFLMTKQATSAPQINVVLNWFEELKQKVPPGT